MPQTPHCWSPPGRITQREVLLACLVGPPRRYQADPSCVLRAGHVRDVRRGRGHATTNSSSKVTPNAVSEPARSRAKDSATIGVPGVRNPEHRPLATVTCSGSVSVRPVAQQRPWRLTCRPFTLTHTDSRPADPPRIDGVVVAQHPHAVVPRQSDPSGAPYVRGCARGATSGSGTSAISIECTASAISDFIDTKQASSTPSEDSGLDDQKCLN